MESLQSNEFKKAARYIDAATKKQHERNFPDAIKLLNKAKNLCPEEQAERIQAHINILKDELEQSGAPSSSVLRNRNVKKSPVSKPATTAPDYTQHQLDLVNRVNKHSKNFYKALGVSRSSGDSDIKRAYKKLALQLHPDKNHAPGAVEAFKIIASAVAVLTDRNKRRSYDATLSDYFSSHLHAHDFFRSYRYGRYYHNMQRPFSPDRHRGTPFYRDQQDIPEQPQGQGPDISHNLFQRLQYVWSIFGFIALMLCMYIWVISCMGPDLHYDLTPSGKYNIGRQTSYLSINYYVDAEFDSLYKGALGRLEAVIEAKVLSSLRQKCRRERNYRNKRLATARALGDRVKFIMAQRLVIPSCVALQNIGLARYSLF